MKIVIADCSWNAIAIEKEQFPEDWIVEGHQCRTEDELIRACADADGILTEYAPVTRRVLEQLKNCKIISNTSTGYDNIDAAAAKEFGIAVANVPDYCSGEVADHTLALILAGCRNIVRYHASVMAGTWDLDAVPPMNRLAGKTLGLVGFGNIARAVAVRAQAFGIRVITYSSVPEDILEAHGVRRVCLDELLGVSDIISSHIPYTEKNADFFSLALFDKMKKRPLFVNTSRGRVVNESDLMTALEQGLISGAALDVLRNEPPDFSSPLFAMKNVIITPHVAYYSVESLEECRRRSAQNVLHYLGGQRDRVDLV